jgi:PAS domain S-box-containing protein
MAYNESLLTGAAFVAAGVSGLTALAAVGRSRASAGAAGDALAGAALAAAVWAVTFALRLSADTAQTASVWLRVGHVVGAVVPTLLLVFALYQTGNAQFADGRIAALLAVEPTAAASLALTNPLHGGYVAGTATVTGGGETALVAVPGVFLIGHLAYSVFVCAVAAAVLGEELLHSAGIYRRRATLSAAAVAIPAVTALTHLADIPIVPQYDTTPIWFGLSAALLLVATRAYGLFDLSPVAHETVFEEVDDAIVVADDRGLVVDANPAARAAFGVDEGDIGRPAPAALPDDDDAVETLLDDGEATLETDDGRHFEATRTPVTATSGTVDAFVFRDVTDRERVERRFQTYIEQSNDVLIVLDTDGVVEYASPAARRVFGSEPAELTGQPVFSLVHPDDRDAVTRAFRSTTGLSPDHDETTDHDEVSERGGVADGGPDVRETTGADAAAPSTDTATTSADPADTDDRESPHTEPTDRDSPRPEALAGDETGTGRERFRVNHADGSWRTVESVVAAGVGDGDDRLLVNVRDVTERQRYEQRLRVLNRVLRHDLRNDANVVLGYADLLLKSDLEPSVRRRAETVREKANRLVELGEQAREVDRTLHAERGESQPIQLHDTVDSVAWRARETYPNAQVDTDVDAPVVALGNELVDSALWHLVSNGIEHNDSTEPWVRITVETDEEWVRVTVTDDGPGIPESERKVLEHGTETALEHGSGLGLWLVKWITDSVGGNVSFAEREPRGSMVTMRFATPVDDTAASDATETASNAADSPSSDPVGGGETTPWEEASDPDEEPGTAGE